MSTWTSAREQIHAAAQKAGEAYALSRKVEEQVRGLAAGVEASERDADDLRGELSGALRRIAALEMDLNRLRAVPAEPRPRARKAA